MNIKIMKSKLLATVLVAASSQLVYVSSANAQEFYPALVRAVGISTNETGLVYHEFDNGNIIRHCAEEQGMTNLAGLRLVYDRTTDAVEVVSGTNNTVVCTPMAFSDGTSLSNTNGTKIQRFAWVGWENSATANGSLIAGESVFPATTNHPAVFNLRGQLQFTVPANGTNPPVIYVGGINAGSRVFENDDYEGESSHRFENRD
jgi:hypothetical protein